MARRHCKACLREGKGFLSCETVIGRDRRSPVRRVGSAPDSRGISDFQPPSAEVLACLSTVQGSVRRGLARGGLLSPSAHTSAFTHKPRTAKDGSQYVVLAGVMTAGSRPGYIGRFGRAAKRQAQKDASHLMARLHARPQLTGQLRLARDCVSLASRWQWFPAPSCGTIRCALAAAGPPVLRRVPELRRRCRGAGSGVWK